MLKGKGIGSSLTINVACKQLIEISKTNSNCVVRGCGGLVVRSRQRGRRIPSSKPDSTKELPCMGVLQAKAYVVAKRLPVGVVRNFGEGGAISDADLLI
ncbi:hypothetical protein AVEN_6974-1 [Araneus ventricosus]|uniref:Uncharacterized protein n=1 Tax=Araneus ventricosus TaxID=182803 RepID=A0A4Y2L6S8_ARAVE|nr:hypothetical protein AVEN_6974-1 [Araneus ventricosus]